VAPESGGGRGRRGAVGGGVGAGLGGPRAGNRLVGDMGAVCHPGWGPRLLPRAARADPGRAAEGRDRETGPGSAASPRGASGALQPADVVAKGPSWIPSLIPWERTP
jgi:hypothetical protein